MIKTMFTRPDLTDFYNFAKEKVINFGFSWEIKWQEKRDFDSISETEFLREVAWVILCSGFRESIVRKKFNYVSLCFYDWESAELIAINKEKCVELALSAFGNQKKLSAISDIADIIHTMGFYEFNKQIQADPIVVLEKLPHIGPITSWHLAKNLGMDVAKNDRHLERIATNYGYLSGQDLCEKISIDTGDQISVVDLVLWRYATLR